MTSVLEQSFSASRGTTCRSFTKSVLARCFSAAVGAAATVLLPSAAAIGAQLDLPNTTYTYTVINQDLSAALLEFGSNLNIKVNVSQEVRGRIQGRLPDLPPLAFLNRLASLYNLEWYFDGQVLHVTSAREAQSRLLVPGPVPFERLASTLAAFNVADERYEVRPAPDTQLVLVTGPPRFVALVEQTLNGLIAEEQARPKPAEARAEPPLLRDAVLTVFRGSQTTILRNGRLESTFGTNESSDGPAQRDGDPSSPNGRQDPR
ncbi:secretin N-terminal domain-containing protein [Bradyrhizobium sp. LHD-71]|uniref:secretin N-terminal domain-containing protein n=1 Tax=Bradyrhizobium sp. LHD-71 TaxID=3072141 RepID=UPI00280FD8B4|nr:secretin N-terminal domain-containing protein [Bradyrhizobium sp. LHD-71]MDQ8726888.1 nodulation protein NolW [Bradyrhizobium sp. LHD-71]